jgi:hypothetical protein
MLRRRFVADVLRLKVTSDDSTQFLAALNSHMRLLPLPDVSAPSEALFEFYCFISLISSAVDPSVRDRRYKVSDRTRLSSILQEELEETVHIIERWDSKLVLHRQLRIDVSKVKEALLRLKLRLSSHTLAVDALLDAVKWSFCNGNQLEKGRERKMTDFIKPVQLVSLFES